MPNQLQENTTKRSWVGAGGLRILWRKWYAGEERSGGISDGWIDGL